MLRHNQIMCWHSKAKLAQYFKNAAHRLTQLMVASMVPQAANIGMMLVYGVTVGMGYGSHGRLVAGFLPASLPNGMSKRLVGLGLCYHIAVSACQKENRKRSSI